MPHGRFDYLARDSLHLSIKLGCDFSRILNFSKARVLRLSLPSTLAPSRPTSLPSSRIVSGTLLIPMAASLTALQCS